MKTTYSFPTESTAYQTKEAKRAMRVLNRSHIADLIDHAGCYACRPIAGSSTMSQHSYGNADDLFPKQHLDQELARSRIFHGVIYQATHKTLANRGKRLSVAHVINHDARLQWNPQDGIHTYSGTYGDHVHVDYNPQYAGACGHRP